MARIYGKRRVYIPELAERSVWKFYANSLREYFIGETMDNLKAIKDGLVSFLKLFLIPLAPIVLLISARADKKRYQRYMKENPKESSSTFIDEYESF